jgi:predicted small integral membrane protein
MTQLEFMVTWFAYSAGLGGIAAFFAAPWLILAAMVAWSFWRRRRDA